MWARRLTTDQQKQLLEQYRQGVPVAKISKQFAVHHSYPALLARRRNMETRLKKTNVRFDDARKDA